MNKVIEFKKNNNLEINEQLLYLFDELDKEIKIFVNSSEYDEELFDDLISYFYEVYNKVKNNSYNNVSTTKFLIKFNSITDEKDKTDKLINSLEYIRLYDILKGNLFKADDEIVKLMLYLPWEFDIDKEFFNNVIKYFQNDTMKKSINEETDRTKKVNKFLEYCDVIEKGYNPILMCNDSKEKTEEISLDSGIMTIDRIYNYYINQANSLRSITENVPSDEILNELEKILLIKKFNNKIQNKFILIARNIDSNCNVLIDKLNCISSLVIIFLHFKDKLDIMDINILESMVLYKTMNEASIENVEEIYERKM